MRRECGLWIFTELTSATIIASKVGWSTSKVAPLQRTDLIWLELMARLAWLQWVWFALLFLASHFLAVLLPVWLAFSAPRNSCRLLFFKPTALSLWHLGFWLALKASHSDHLLKHRCWLWTCSGLLAPLSVFSSKFWFFEFLAPTRALSSALLGF